MRKPSPRSWLDAFRPRTPETAKGRRPDDACGSHSLLDCCRLWGVALREEDAHGAAADALAAGRLAWRLATDPLRFAIFDSFRPAERIDPSAWTLELLHAWQAEQYAEEAKRVQSYRRGEQRRKPDEIDPGCTIAREWPIQPAPDGWTPDQLPAERRDGAA